MKADALAHSKAGCLADLKVGLKVDSKDISTAVALGRWMADSKVGWLVEKWVDYWGNAMVESKVGTKGGSTADCLVVPKAYLKVDTWVNPKVDYLVGWKASPMVAWWAVGMVSWWVGR